MCLYFSPKIFLGAFAVCSSKIVMFLNIVCLKIQHFITNNAVCFKQLSLNLDLHVPFLRRHFCPNVKDHQRAIALFFHFFQKYALLTGIYERNRLLKTPSKNSNPNCNYRHLKFMQIRFLSPAHFFFSTAFLA